MSVFWQFTRFDYDLFLNLRKELRAAETPEHFAALSVNSLTDSLVAALEAGEIMSNSARNGFVRAICCIGEPLLLDSGLLRIVVRLSHTRGTEDLGELLESLLGSGLNLESWFQPGDVLSGFLTPEQTLRLDTDYGKVLRRGGSSTGKRRQGGLLGKGREFLRQLFAMEARPEESLRLFGELVEAAAAIGQGVAVVSG